MLDVIAAADTNPLSKRGIAAAAQHANWTTHTLYSRAGWRYPIFDTAGQVIAYRWKAAPGQDGAKYLWVNGKPDNAAVNWYILPQTDAAIENEGGVCWLANGEPALLAYHAAGVPQVITTTLSEVAVPADAVERLRALGVSRLLYPVDNDDAGFASAVKWRDALRGSGIDFVAFTWGAEAPAKADANDIWMACGFNRAAFQEILDQLEPLELPAPDVEPEYAFDASGYDETPAGLVQAILSAAGEQGYQGRGDWLRGQCLFHDDTRASAGISRETGVCNCFVCGAHSAWDTARQLGIDPGRFYPQRERRRRKKNGAAAEKSKDEFAALDHGVALPAFPATMTVNLPYISDLPLSELGLTNAIRSPLGTGKTELVIQLIRALDRLNGQPIRVLLVSHLQSLTRNISDRLSRALETPVECYQDLPPGYRVSATRLVCSYDSLAQVGSEWDLVVIDEHEQFHRHLGSGTMRGGEPLAAYLKLVQVVREARQVMALDAHLSATSVDWLTALRGEVTAIENTYRCERGELTVQRHESAVLAAAFAEARRNTDGIVLLSNSRTKSWLYYDLAVAQFGADAVQIINGQTSDSREAAQVLEALSTAANGQTLCEALPGCRVLIASPSLGTGFDIQARVSGVYGVFTRQIWVNGYTILQQLMRYRQADTRQLCLIGGFASETAGAPSADQIDRQQHQRAQGTAHSARFGTHGIPVSSALLDEINRLQARLDADSALHRTDLFSYTLAVARAEGFCLQFRDGYSRTVADALRDARADRAEQIKEAVLTTPALSPERFDALRQTQPRTADLVPAHHGLERWRIEQAAGQGIHGDLYDKLHTAQKRADFRRLVDWLDDPAVPQQRDRQEAQVQTLLSQRGHHTVTLDLIRRGLEAVFGHDPIYSDEQLTDDQIEVRLADFIDQYGDQVALYLDSRRGLSREPLAVLRRLLARLWLRLGRQQVMVDGVRFYVYFIDPNWRETLLNYAQTALAARWDAPLLHSVLSVTPHTERSNATGERGDPPERGVTSPPERADHLNPPR